MQKICASLPGIFKGYVGFFAGGIGPMRVGVVVVQIVVHCFDYRAGNLGPARAVEISYGVAVVNPFESGKVVANFFDRCNGGFG